MRVYVAGSGQERERVREFMDALRAQGHTVTFDWTAVWKPDADTTDYEAASVVVADTAGIRCAEVFVLLRPRLTSFGCAFEAGFAKALGSARLILVGSNAHPFLRLWERYASDAEALEALGAV